MNSLDLDRPLNLPTRPRPTWARVKGLAAKFRDYSVLDRTGRYTGRCVGSFPCRRPGCRGHRLVVRWVDGLVTCPCSREGMAKLYSGTLQLRCSATLEDSDGEQLSTVQPNDHAVPQPVG